MMRLVSTQLTISFRVCGESSDQHTDTDHTASAGAGQALRVKLGPATPHRRC